MGKLFVHSIKRAKAVFVQNETDKEDLKKTTGVCSVMIPNGHRLKTLPWTERKTILWVGRSAGFKHPERFLKLARAFPKEPFVIICQKATGDKCYNSLRSKANQVGNLRFLEHISFDKIDAYFEQAKIFVNTSDSEGFPNTFIQACKAGTAILSYVVNPDGFLDTYHCGVNCHGNETTLMDQLRDMLDADHYLKLGRNGRKYVIEKHNIIEIVERYKSIFTKCR